MNTILIVLPILTVLMFDLGLTLEGKDFLLVAKRYKAVLVGMTGQLLILPLLAWLVARTLGLGPVFTIGLVLIACCPGGSSSNIFSMLAKGDVALSVSLTALSSVITLFTVPVILQMVTSSVGESIGVTLPVGNLLVQNLLTMLLPILLGIGVRKLWPKVAAGIERVLSKLAFPALMLLAGIFFVQHRVTIVEHFLTLGTAVTVLLIGAIGVAALLSVVFRLRTKERRTIVIEVGMQNAAQAIAIASSPFVLGDGRFAIPAILYALMMNVVLLCYVGVVKTANRSNESNKPNGTNKTNSSNRANALLLLVLCGVPAWARDAKATTDGGVRVEGTVHAGLSTQINNDADIIDLEYTTGDPRLGTNSGNHYSSTIDDRSRNVHATYGAGLDIHLHPQHTLSVTVEGAEDYERAIGSRTEIVTDKDGQAVSHAAGTYNHPNELTNDLTAGLGYSYRFRRPGEMLTVAYRYHWENENTLLEQQINDANGWSLYGANRLQQRIHTHNHHAGLEYVLPVAKGHLLDFGAAYDRRDLTVATESLIDGNSTYRHLMQYGGVHARYRLRLGAVTAMARLEYRATRMQNRYLHDVLPTATIRYQIDSIHSLSAFYTIVLIRPGAHHLDTTHIREAYTENFGSDRLVGMHIHNVALTYRMQLAGVDASAEIRYLTTKDGFNAIWMERGDRRLYTWGNEGLRHAVSLTPTVHAPLSNSTEIDASAVVMWDQRVAAAIGLVNGQWGIRTTMRLSQRLTPQRMKDSPDALALYLVGRGEYAYHNTIDVYSYAGHGGLLGCDARLMVRKVNLSLGYTCFFRPDVHIWQGGFVGTLRYAPGVMHELALNVVCRI